SLDGGTYQASGTFNNVAAGAHTITARSTTDITCISTPTNVTINAQPTPPTAPSVNTVQPTCAVATGTITVTTVPGLEYSLDGGTYQASGTFNNVAAGAHTITASSTTDITCISTPTNVTINAQPTPPTAPSVNTVQPTCAVATGTITV